MYDKKKMNPLKDQINSICNGLSEKGEDSFFVSVNLEQTTCFVIGSEVGLTWLDTQNSMLQQFYRYCAAVQRSKKIKVEIDNDFDGEQISSAVSEKDEQISKLTDKPPERMVKSSPKKQPVNSLVESPTKMTKDSNCDVSHDTTVIGTVTMEVHDTPGECKPNPSTSDNIEKPEDIPNEADDHYLIKNERKSLLKTINRKRKHTDVDVPVINIGKHSDMKNKVQVRMGSTETEILSAHGGRPRRTPKPRKLFSMECYEKSENVNKYLMNDFIPKSIRDELKVNRSEVANDNCSEKRDSHDRTSRIKEKTEAGQEVNNESGTSSNDVCEKSSNGCIQSLASNTESVLGIDTDERKNKITFKEFLIKNEVDIGKTDHSAPGPLERQNDDIEVKVHTKSTENVVKKSDECDYDEDDDNGKKRRKVKVTNAEKNHDVSSTSNVLDMNLLIKNYLNNMRSRVKRSRKRKNGHIPCPTCQLSFTSMKGLRHHSRVCQLIKCPRCDKHCKSIEDLKEHVETHKGEELYRCKVCGEQFLLITQLKKHETKHNTKKYSCPLCPKSFFSATVLRHHVREAHNESRFCCAECGVLYSDQFEYNKHISIHNKRRKIPVFTCQKCGKSFEMLLYLKRHNRFYHRTVGERICNFCLQFFKSQEELDEHVKTHKGDNPNTCRFCQESFSTKPELNVHIHKEHKQGTMYMCDVCGFQADSGLVMKHHKYKHDEKMPYSCDTCGKGFTLKHKLKSHMISHQTDSTYICEVCGMTFRRESTLRSHKVVHSEGNQCQFCPKVFRSTGGLNYHIIRNHTSLIDIENYRHKVYQCEKCKIFFPSKSSMLQHKVRHMENKSFKCGNCGKRFKTEEHLKTHAASHSNVKSHYCQACNTSFLTKERLAAHILTEKHKKNVQHTESCPVHIDSVGQANQQVISSEGSSIILTIPEEINVPVGESTEHTIYIIGGEVGGEETGSEIQYEISNDLPTGIQYIQEGNQLIPYVDPGSLSQPIQILENQLEPS